MKYTRLLPFMDKQELNEIASQVINGELKGVKLETLFPFLGRDNLDALVDQMIETKNTKSLERAIPFLSREKVAHIYELAENGDIENFNTESCIPFLGSEKIKEIFQNLIRKAAESGETEEVEADDD